MEPKLSIQEADSVVQIMSVTKTCNTGNPKPIDERWRRSLRQAVAHVQVLMLSRPPLELLRSPFALFCTFGSTSTTAAAGMPAAPHEARRQQRPNVPRRAPRPADGSAAIPPPQTAAPSKAGRLLGSSCAQEAAPSWGRTRLENNGPNHSLAQPRQHTCSCKHVTCNMYM